jgi:uncharacterized phage protein (TIGR02218 family)
MRTVPGSFAEQLAAGVTSFAHVWKVTRRDNVVFGFTDHDRPLAFDGLDCEPNVGLRVGAIEKTADLAVDTAHVSGSLSSAAITEADLARGVWDGARVDLYRVDWNDASQRVHLFAGRIGEARRGVNAFEAELRGLQAPLNVAVGRVFSRYCDADLGDARCGKDVSGASYLGSGTVTTVLGTHALRASGLSGFESDWFTRGKLAWTSGGQSEVAVHRTDGGDAVLELLDAPGASLTVGATFTITAGCDKSFATCRAKFANSDNFRGFPHMPGNDAVQAGPAADQPLDGSSRFS